MSRKIKSVKNEKIEYRTANGWLAAVRWVTDIYLITMILIYPFVIRQGYGSTSFIKYSFLIGVSYDFSLGVVRIPTFIPISLFLILIGTIKYIRDTDGGFAGFIKGMRLSALDIAVLFYTMSLIISTVISPYKDELLWGYPTWNMGLASQFLFIMVYYLVSRFFDMLELELMVYISLAASGVVFLIGVLQRFGIDIFDLYHGMAKKGGFISTIGQSSWFSSYMIIFVVISVFIVWYFEKSELMYKAGVIHLIIGSVCLVVQNTDSAYAGLFIALSFFFVWSFDSIERMLSFLETSLVILLSWRVTGFAQIVAGDNMAVRLGRLSIFMSQSPLLWILIGILALAYILLRFGVKRGRDMDISKYRLIGRIYTGLVIAVIIGLFIYIVLNTKKLLPEALLSKNNYLRFNRKWGNKRGAILHDTVLSFIAELRTDPVKGIFGVGADQFYHVIKDYVSKWTHKTNPKSVLTNAHNEWLTAFVNYGIFGGLAYLGIFVCSVARSAGHRRNAPYVMATAGCVAAYMAHNLFCYQQYICTPYIFIVIALGEQITREIHSHPLHHIHRHITPTPAAYVHSAYKRCSWLHAISLFSPF